MAKQLAKELGYIYVDSGAMYRCVALFALNQGFYSPELNKELLISKLDDIKISFRKDLEKNTNRTFLGEEDVEDAIRGMEISNLVSEIAAISEVRKKLVSIQKKMGKDKGVVMDGRDIGSVVFPDAELKIFMTASAQVRARRRFEELVAKGAAVTYQEVLENVEKRDSDDSTRADSPLLVAEDARVLDNSEIDRKAQFQLALSWANEAISNK